MRQGCDTTIRVCARFQLGHHVLGDSLHFPEVVSWLMLLGVCLPRESVVVA